MIVKNGFSIIGGYCSREDISMQFASQDFRPCWIFPKESLICSFLVFISFKCSALLAVKVAVLVEGGIHSDQHEGVQEPNQHN